MTVVSADKQATENQLWRAFLAAGYEPTLRPIGGGRSTTKRRWKAVLYVDDAGNQLGVTDVDKSGRIRQLVGEGASRKVALRKLLNKCVKIGLDPLEVWRSIDARCHGNPRATETAGKRHIDGQLPDRLAAVLAVIVDTGQTGITDRDLEHRLGWPRGEGAKRRHELFLDGFVDRNGSRISQSTGHRGDIWVATPEGHQVAEQLGITGLFSGTAA